jgi:hypothetical protein
MGGSDLLFLAVILLLVAAAIIAGYTIKIRSDERRAGMAALWEAAARASTSTIRQPELTFATRGFARVAIVKAANVDTDLANIARSEASEFRKAGCSNEQELSALWGGIVAANANHELLNNFLISYDDATAHIPNGEVSSHPLARYEGAGSLYLTLQLRQAPDDFERFLRSNQAVLSNP